MPIVFVKGKGWTLKDATDEERDELIEIAVEQITESFGHDVAKNILLDAAKFHSQNKEESKAGVVYDAPTIN